MIYQIYLLKGDYTFQICIHSDLKEGAVDEQTNQSLLASQQHPKQWKDLHI